jgi:hypothetical protein
LFVIKIRSEKVWTTASVVVECILVYDNDPVQAWSSKMVVVGTLATAPSKNDAKGSNLLGIAYSKAGEMAETLQVAAVTFARPKPANTAGGAVWSSGEKREF